MRAPRQRRSRGFSLLEVLVAFVILALVATAVFELFGGGLRNAAAADEWSRAVLLAQSRLALAAAASPLREATDEGAEEDGRMRWTTRVAPYVPDDAGAGAAAQAAGQAPLDTLPNRLWRVEADVVFPGTLGRERRLSLATLRLAPKEPAR